MSEGPEVHRIADDLAERLVGQRLKRIYFAHPRLKIWEQRLRRSRIEGVRVRGRAWFFRLQKGLFLYSESPHPAHWKIRPPETRAGAAERFNLELVTERASAALLLPSKVAVLTQDQLFTHPTWSAIGPDVLDPSLDETMLCERLLDPRFAKRQLSSLLADPNFVSGLGNVLRSEILFAAGIEPVKRLVRCNERERTRLASALIEVPRRSYEYGEHAFFSTKLLNSGAVGVASLTKNLVFDREGERCVDCAAKIRRSVLSRKPLYWCPNCQR